MAESKPSNRKPLWIIMAGFSVVLIANAALVYFAVNTWTGLETEQHYVKGLAYNTNLEAAKRQQALGWSADFIVEFVNSDGLSGTSKIRFTDKDGKAMTHLDVRVHVSRPTHDGFDSAFDLSHSGEGIYRGAFSLPLKGLWDFRILARRGDDDFQRVERIVTPSGQ